MQKVTRWTSLVGVYRFLSFLVNSLHSDCLSSMWNFKKTERFEAFRRNKIIILVRHLG